MVVNGTNVLIYENDTALGHSTSAVLSLTLDTPSATTKTSGGWFEVIPGKRTATMKADGLVDYSDAFNWDQIMDRIITTKDFKWVFQAPSMFYFGEGRIIGAEEVSENQNAVSYSMDILIDGRVYFEPRLPWNLVFSNWENINIEWQNV